MSLNKRQKTNHHEEISSTNPPSSAQTTDALSAEYNHLPSSPLVAFSRSRIVTHVVPVNNEDENIDIDIMAWLRGDSIRRQDSWPAWNQLPNVNGLPEQTCRLEDSISEPLNPFLNKPVHETVAIESPIRHSPRFYPGTPSPQIKPSIVVAAKSPTFDDILACSPIKSIRPTLLTSLFKMSPHQPGTPRQAFSPSNDRHKLNTLVQQASQSLYELKGSVNHMAPPNQIGFIHDVPAEFLQLIIAYSNFILSAYQSHQRDQPP